jgi:hypothetical protein
MLLVRTENRKAKEVGFSLTDISISQLSLQVTDGEMAHHLKITICTLFHSSTNCGSITTHSASPMWPKLCHVHFLILKRGEDEAHHRDTAVGTCC